MGELQDIGPFFERSSVYITDASGSGISDENKSGSATSPVDKLLVDFDSDNDTITLAVEVHMDGTDWQPGLATLLLDGVSTGDTTSAWTNTGDRVFTASITQTDAATDGAYTIQMADGAVSNSVGYERLLDPPNILSVQWDDQGTNPDPYPAIQTQFKNGDDMQLSGTCDSHATEVYVKGISGSATHGRGLQGPYAASGGTWSAANVKAGSDDNTTAHVVVYCKVGGGANGADFNSETDQTPATVITDQTTPDFGSFSVNYNGSQEAAKGAETFDITLVSIDPGSGDTFVYSDPTGTDVTIPSVNDYVAEKLGVTINTAGIYRDAGIPSPDNYRLTITRAGTNGAVGSSSSIVNIADVAPVVTIARNTSGSALPRLRTDDGTNNYLDDTVFVNSNQHLLSTSTSSVIADAGDTSDWKPASSWVAGGDSKSFKRDKRVADADIVTGHQAANDHTWGVCSATNKAGTVTTSVTTNPNYSLGGFQARTLTIPAWPNREADCSVPFVDTTKLLAELLSKGGDGSNGGTDQTFDNSPGESSTPDDEVDKFCGTAGDDIVLDDGQFWYNKDQAAAIANSSGTAQVIVEETA